MFNRLEGGARLAVKEGDRHNARLIRRCKVLAKAQAAVPVEEEQRAQRVQRALPLLALVGRWHVLQGAPPNVSMHVRCFLGIFMPTQAAAQCKGATQVHALTLGKEKRLPNWMRSSVSVMEASVPAMHDSRSSVSGSMGAAAGAQQLCC